MSVSIASARHHCSSLQRRALIITPAFEYSHVAKRGLEFVPLGVHRGTKFRPKAKDRCTPGYWSQHNDGQPRWSDRYVELFAQRCATVQDCERYECSLAGYRLSDAFIVGFVDDV